MYSADVPKHMLCTKRNKDIFDLIWFDLILDMLYKDVHDWLLPMVCLQGHPDILYKDIDDLSGTYHQTVGNGLHHIRWRSLHVSIPESNSIWHFPSRYYLYITGLHLGIDQSPPRSMSPFILVLTVNPVIFVGFYFVKSANNRWIQKIICPEN